MQKITYLNGERLHRAITVGIHKVISKQEYLNKINVFPVPDGDTGTNIAFTLNSVLNGTKNLSSQRADSVLSKIADSALDGARGNSGVILAQFFQGFNEGAEGCDVLDVKNFAVAVKSGADAAREALAEPKEGTILTVIQDFSLKINAEASNNTNDFENLIKVGLAEAEKSLKNTPELLAILKKSGVVDAGAEGFVEILRGIDDFISNGSIKELENDYESLKLDDIDDHIDLAHDIDNIKFKYCTECLIISDNINRRKLKREVSDLGDSQVVAGSKQKVKLHIHTNDPEAFFNICEGYGSVEDKKFEDMLQQQKAVSSKKTAKIAIVTDSGADLPSDYTDLGIYVVPLRYSFGDKDYKDKQSQTPEEFYNELQTNEHHPKTSQPTSADFTKQYNYLSSHYESLISIHIPHKLSGTMQSAMNSASKIKTQNNIIDSMNASVGLGLLVYRAAEVANDGASHNEIIDEVSRLIDKTSVFLGINDLSYGVKGGRVGSSKKKIADLLRIRPVLTTSHETGEIKSGGILFGTSNIDQKLAKFVAKKIDPSKKYRFAVAHSDSKDGAERIMSYLKKSIPNSDFSYLIDLGCALGVHAGPGSYCIGLQEIG